MEAGSDESANTDGGGVEDEARTKAAAGELVRSPSISNIGNADWRASTNPPVDDCCPICFGDFTAACKADCGHWYCGSCILQLWNYSAVLRPCKCPMCSSSITNLTPEASLLNRQQGHVVEVLRSVGRYNQLNFGGARGPVLKLLETPLLLKQLVMRMIDPYGPDYRPAARIFAMILVITYMLAPFEIVLLSRGNLAILFNSIPMLIVDGLRVIGLYRQWRLNRRVRRMAAEPLVE